MVNYIYKTTACTLLQYKYSLIFPLYSYRYLVILRAKRLLNSTAHSNIGAYTTSKGLPLIRESVANYLEQRDGIPANIDNIYLTNGASAGITYALKCLISNASDGILLEASSALAAFKMAKHR